MPEASDPLIKHYDKDPDTGEMVPVRYMSPEEIKERADLQMANTSEKMRNRVLEHHAKSNGHSVGSRGYDDLSDIANRIIR